MPPRTWRIQPRWNGDIDSLGITSTYVENTLNMHLPLMHQQDHLHIRGEYSIVAIVIVSKVGSPPHTWRIQYQPVRLSGRLRITSTYMENTASLYQIQSPKRDHLHIRGEYRAGIFGMKIVLGSPPHTWRILDQWHKFHQWLRITSTYVENTAKK